MNIANTIRYWNAGVSLSHPTISQLRAACGIQKTTPVFDGMPYLLFAGDNFLVTFSFLANKQSDPIVQVISVALVTDFFTEKTLVEVENLSGLKMFGLPLKGSAEEFLRHLEKGVSGAFDLVTESDGWIIRYGRALGFHFSPLPGRELASSNSRMTEISFNFGPSYVGGSPPILEVNL